jgi:hypothetical protein
MRVEFVKRLAAKYIADPNCWPELWISGEGLTEQERALFFNILILYYGK